MKNSAYTGHERLSQEFFPNSDYAVRQGMVLPTVDGPMTAK